MTEEPSAARMVGLKRFLCSFDSSVKKMLTCWSTMRYLTVIVILPKSLIDLLHKSFSTAAVSGGQPPPRQLPQDRNFIAGHRKGGGQVYQQYKGGKHRASTQVTGIPNRYPIFAVPVSGRARSRVYSRRRGYTQAARQFKVFLVAVHRLILLLKFQSKQA